MPLSAAQRNAALKTIADVNDQARQISGAFVMPPMGGASDTHLREPAGSGLRPFAPGEYVNNPDGSWSSERSMTVPGRGGKWEVIPSVYLRDGRPVEASSEDEAVKLARESGKQYRSFPSLDAAEKFSIDRENEWQKFERPEDAASIAPLYEPSKPKGGAVMRTPNHVRDRVYGIIADPNLDPAAKALALKQLGAAGEMTAADIRAPSIQLPVSTAALPDVRPSSGGIFSRALAFPEGAAAGQAAGMAMPPMGPGPAPGVAMPPAGPAPGMATPATVGPPPLARPPSAAFADVTAPPSAAFPDTAPPGLGDEIDRRRALTLAALGTPTDYPTVR